MRPVLLLCLALGSAVQAADRSPVSVDITSISESRFKAFEEDKKHPFADDKLEITLLLKGPAAQHATHWGHVKLLQAADDTGKPLKLQSGFEKPDKSFLKINREQMWFFHDDPPQDAIKVALALDPSSRSSTKLRVLKGTLQLKASRNEEVIVENLDRRVGQTIKHPTLKKGGLVVSVVKFEPDNPSEYIKLKVTGPEEACEGFSLIDPQGEELSNSRMWFRVGNSTNLGLGGDGPLPQGVRLKVLVETQKDVTNVPFSFKDVPLP